MTAWRFVQWGTSCSPSMGGYRAAAGRHHHGAAGAQHVVVHATRRSPARRPCPRKNPPRASLFEPRLHPGVVEVVDDLIAPRQRRRSVQLTGHRLARAGNAAHLGQQLPGPQRVSTACRRRTSTRHRSGVSSTSATSSPPSARRPAQTLPALGPPPGRHRVELALAHARHRIPPYAWRWTGPSASLVTWPTQTRSSSHSTTPGGASTSIFTDEHDQLRDSIHSFVTASSRRTPRSGREKTFPDWVFRRMGELGFSASLSPRNTAGRAGTTSATSSSPRR